MQRSLFERNGNLRDTRLQPLACPNVERNAGPAPILNVQLHAREGLGSRLRIDAILFSVADDRLAVDDAGTILPAHRIGHRNWINGAPDLQLLGADGLRLEAVGRLHRNKAQHFHHMVLQNVAECTGLLVERTTPFNANRLCRRNLNAIDVIAIPDWLEDPVAEAKDQDVLYGLLSEIVIDAEDLVLGQYVVQFVVQLARALQ